MNRDHDGGKTGLGSSWCAPSGGRYLDPKIPLDAGSSEIPCDPNDPSDPKKWDREWDFGARQAVTRSQLLSHDVAKVLP
jgi:hypothetical protein